RNYKDRVVVEKSDDKSDKSEKKDQVKNDKCDGDKSDDKKETVPKDKLPDTILNTDCFYTTEIIPVGEHDLAVAIKIGDSIKSFTVKIKVKEPKKIELANLSGFAGDTLTLPTIDELILKENIKYLIDGKEFTNSFTLPENKSSVNIKIKNGKYVIYETDFSYEKVTRFEPQILNKQKFYLASSILKVSLPSSFCNGKSNILGNWIISPFYQSQKVNLCESFDLILPYNLKADGLNDLNLQYKYNNLYSSNYKIQVFKPTLNVSLSSENNNKISKIYRNQRIKIQFESNLCIHSKSINSIMNVIGVDGREDSLHFDICSKQLFYTVPSSWPSSLIDFDFMFEYAPHNKFKLSKIDYSNNSRDINQDTTSETSESSETTVVNSDPEVSRKQGSRRSTRASSTSTSSTSSTKSSSRTSLSSRRFATKKSSTRKSSTSRKSSTKKSLAKSLSAGSSTKKTSATSSNANSKATGSEHDSDFVTVTTENTLTQVAALANKAPFNDIAQVKSVIKKNKQSNESKENNTVLYASLGAAADVTQELGTIYTPASSQLPSAYFLAFPTALPDNPADIVRQQTGTIALGTIQYADPPDPLLTSPPQQENTPMSPPTPENQNSVDPGSDPLTYATHTYNESDNIDRAGCTDEKCETCKPGFLPVQEPERPCKRRLDFAIRVQPVECSHSNPLKFYDNGDHKLRLNSATSNKCLGSKRVSKLWAAEVDCDGLDFYKFVPKMPALVEQGDRTIDVDFQGGNGFHLLDWDEGFLHVAGSGMPISLVYV
ncbi:hypothetical protein ROZALSC1DRAFT_24265, partial [Rozella allomycis CSF55]